jgi:type 1 glutamine amidotransferase
MNRYARSLVCLVIAAGCGWLALCDALGAKREPPPARTRAEVEAVLAKAPQPPAAADLRPLHIVLLASKKDHGPNEHDYPLWQKRWKVLLGGKGTEDEPKVNLFSAEPTTGRDTILAGAPKVKVSTAMDWPGKEQLESAHLVVMFSKPRWNPETLKDLEALLARGGGFVITHMAIWQKSKELADVIGMAAGGQTKYRHGPVDLKIADPKHPITLGLPKTIHLVDETYFHFQGDPGSITTLATCDERIEKGKDAMRSEPIFWARERGKGKVFVCILGHFNWTFDDPLFRIVMLRGMAWAAGESPYRFDKLAPRGAILTEK